jgi:hypothetical protein
MFVGITLTKEQIDSIVTLSHVIGKARRERLAQIPSYVAERSQGVRGWDSTTREIMAEFVEQERLAYRAVLDSEQQERYDRNTAMIMQLWVEGNRRRDAKRQAAAAAASQAQ